MGHTTLSCCCNVVGAMLQVILHVRSVRRAVWFLEATGVARFAAEHHAAVDHDGGVENELTVVNSIPHEQDTGRPVVSLLRAVEPQWKTDKSGDAVGEPDGAGTGHQPAAVTLAVELADFDQTLVQTLNPSDNCAQVGAVEMVGPVQFTQRGRTAVLRMTGEAFEVAIHEQ